MNKTFRSLWSAALQTWVAVAETVATRGKRSSGVALATTALTLLGLASGAAAQTAPPPTALPTGGQVMAGQASISQNGASMLIQQGSERAAINWQSFNVGSQAQVQFQQPSASSVTLNRVLSSDPSQIFGRITANGQVILTNPAGVYFGPTARVDVGGLIATTKGISDADFMAGKSRYERGTSTGSVVNEGELRAALGGYIALLAPEVRNQGAIIAQMGTVAMASGEAVDLRFDSSNRLTSVRVEPSQIRALVDNRHAVQAPGGLIILAAQSLNQLLGGLVKNSGSIEAVGLQQQGGRIVLAASTSVEQAGTLNASSANAQGGQISLSAGTIELKDGSRIDATGATGGGTVRVGGGWQGAADPLLASTMGDGTVQATRVNMAACARIDASATDVGNGGEIVLWSDIHNTNSVTDVQGSLHAQGGSQGGDGGRIETSGHLTETTGALVHAGADQGKGGLWLIDPYDYLISNATSINTSLNNGTSVTIETANASSGGVSASGSGSGNITLSTSIGKTAGSAATLTLNAANYIDGTGAISSSGNALDVVFNAGGGTGNFSGLISGNVRVTKSGAGRLNLLSANTYTGGTTMSAGTLGLYSNTALGAGALTAAGSTSVLIGRAVTTIANDMVLNGAVNFAFDQDVEYLLVGGGAGGGGGGISSGPGYGGGGGGGGAGELETGALQLGGGAVAVAVGAGGTGGFNGVNHANWNGGNGTHGGASSLAGASAAGGLYGEGAGQPGVDSRWGGTGGASGAGYLGGLRVTFWDWSSGGGGGGGAGGVGTAAPNTNSGGVGGAGVMSSFTGASITYGLGGTGGGKLAPDNTAGANGGANTGSGGGGGSGSRWSAGVGGTGGSGLVVVRYLGGAAGSGGSVSTGTGSAAGYTLHTYASTGAGTLSLDSLATTLSGNISGAGTLVANAAGGQINLAGTNSYGATTLSGGTLQVGVGGGTGTLGTGAVSNNGALVFDRTGSVTVGGVISGAGSFTKNGAGTLVLTGNNTYSNVTTINAGAVHIGNGGSSGTLGTTYVTNNGSLTFNRADDVTVVNAIYGSGALTKSGGNILTLTSNGALSYSGATTVGGGTLVVKNNAPSRQTSGFNGTGALRIEPAGTAFTSAFSTSGWNFGSTLSGLTLGSSTNTAEITIASSTSIAGPIGIYGGNININAGLVSTGTGTDALITLQGSGNVTDGPSGYVQTGSTGNGSLRLLGGNVTLDNSASNDVFDLAASGVSGLTYLDKAGLRINTVGGTQGIAASGVVNIGTQTGSLTVMQSVTTTSTASNALTLNASIGSAVGADTSYNLLLSGNPTISVGSGGTGRLFSGGISSSTGLASLSGLSAGNGRFRYNADETTNFSSGSWTALGSGLYAIYREQPSATVSSSSQVLTYGEAVNSTGTGSGLVNGDTVSLSVAGAQTSGAGLLKASGTPYTLNHNLTGLGYSVTGSAGTVTVNAKALTVSGLSAANKPYDGGLTATVNGTAVLQAAIASGAGSASDGKRYTSDTVSLSGTATGAFNDKDVLDASTVSFTGLSLTGSDASNYTLTPHANVSASIAAKTVSLVATKTYDGTAAFTGNQLAITTGVGSETLAYSGALASSKHVAPTGKYLSALTLLDGGSGGVASNYQLPSLTAASGNNQVTINAATLTPTLTNTGVSKTYDATTNAPTGFTPSWSFSGLASGDTSAALSFTAASYNAATVAGASTLTVGGLAISSISGSNGSQASDYALSASSRQVAAAVTRATLTVRANNDAKFVTQADPVNFAGVSYSGFVGGEGTGALGGAATVTRSNASTNTAGSYAGVLQPGGLTAANYQFNYVGGDFTVVPSNQLLVRVNNVSNTYGTATSYAVGSVEYYNGSNVVRLDDGTVSGSSVSVANNVVTVNDGASGVATFTVSPQSGQYSTANKLKAGSYQLGLAGAVTENSVNFSDTVTVVGAHQVATKALTASASGGVSKVYDGTTAMNGVSLALATLETADAVSVSGVGAFGSRHAGSSLSYTINNLALAGADAGNYHLSGGSSFSGSNGSITAKAVTLSPQAASRVYNGATGYTATAADMAYLSGLLGVSGDTVTAATLGFADKNVGTGKTLTATSAAVSDGNSGNNYTITLGSNTSSSITRLNSVTWIGGASGNWFDPANWAGGAVPDRANVANVMIPANVTVSFDTTGAVAPADASAAVQVDSLGTAGSLSQSNGTLNVGAGGITLAHLTQTGGTLTNAGTTTLDSFTQSGGNFSGTGTMTAGQFSQTGGNTSLSSHLTVTQGFIQGTSGSLSVGGNASLTDTSGGVQLGNLSTTGNLTVNSTGGAITQAGGTALTVGGSSSFAASNGGARANITLDNAGNDFTGPVDLSGATVSLRDANALALGSVTTTGNLTLQSNGALDLGTATVGGNLSASSGNGNITQTGALGVAGTSNLQAGTGNITLTHAGNDFTGAVSAGGTHVSLRDANALALGSVITTGNLTLQSSGALDLGASTVGGNLNANSGNGAITQTGALNVTGTSNLQAGTGNITLNHAANDFVGAVSAGGANVSLRDANALALGTATTTGNLTLQSSGALDLGTSTLGGNLDATSGNGNITQTGALNVAGASNLQAGNGNVTLTHAGNQLQGQVTARGARVAVRGDRASEAGSAQGQMLSSVAPPSKASANFAVGAGVATAPVVQLQGAAGVDATLMVTVLVSRGLSTSGVGFSFQLPEQVQALGMDGSLAQVSQVNGTGLPAWLRFDAAKLRFEAGAVPDGSFPLQLSLVVGGRSVTIVISERPS